MPNVLIRWLSSSDRPSAGRIWETLQARLGNDALACSWEWTSVWLAHYGDVVPHRFAIAEVEGIPCGIALVTNGVRNRGPFKVRSVHLGTAGEPRGEGVFVEYNRVLVESEQRRDFARALISELRRESGWHELKLDGFAPEEAAPFLEAEPLLHATPTACRTMNLRSAESADGGVLAALGSGTRRQVRRSLKALGEDVQTEWAQTPEHALEILDELIELHQGHWIERGHPGAFASPRFAGFHRELTPRLLPKGAVILFRVRAAGRTVGCLYNFIEHRRVLSYQTGFASYAGRRISPGVVSFALCMQACFERGLIEYDFLAGDSAYKQQLSTTTRELVWATRRRPALRWAAMDRLAAVRRRIRANSRGA
jgi:CelD/BcsL family acetyltransferase involved in cellulose biosynthesis